jgi:hypothetical protein
MRAQMSPERPRELLESTLGLRPMSPGFEGAIYDRSYWIPGSYAPTLSKNRNAFSRLLKNKGLKNERMTKVGLYAIDKSTTLESNKSHFLSKCHGCEPVGIYFLRVTLARFGVHPYRDDACTHPNSPYNTA